MFSVESMKLHSYLILLVNYLIAFEFLKKNNLTFECKMCKCQHEHMKSIANKFWNVGLPFAVNDWAWISSLRVEGKARHSCWKKVYYEKGNREASAKLGLDEAEVIKRCRMRTPSIKNAPAISWCSLCGAALIHIIFPPCSANGETFSHFFSFTILVAEVLE